MVFSRRQKSGERGRRGKEREEFVARARDERSFQFGVVLLKGEGKFTARVGRVKIYYWSSWPASTGAANRATDGKTSPKIE